MDRGLPPLTPPVALRCGEAAALLGRLDAAVGLFEYATGSAALSLSPAAWAANSPPEVHGWIPSRLRLRAFYQVAYLATTALDDATIAVCRDTARRFGRRARRLTVVANGIALPAAAPAAPAPPLAPFRLGFVGRLTPEKGFLMAVAVFAEARRHLRAGETLNVVHQGLSGVHFHGWVEPGLLLTSREEGLPYVLLEAMAVGCPALATTVGGVPEVIEDGRSGHVFAPDDVPAAARAILALVRDPSMVDGVCGVYAEALARRDRHA